MRATTTVARPLVCGALALGLAAGHATHATGAEKKAFARPVPPTPAVSAPLAPKLPRAETEALSHPRTVDAADKYEAALKKYAEPAAKGDVKAQLELGRAFRCAKATKANARQALHWLRAAARANLPAAHYQLGLLYMAGTGGVDPDLVEAYARFKIAQNGGDVRAAAMIFYIGVRMTAEELRRAHERIADIHRFETGPAAPPVEADTAKTAKTDKPVSTTVAKPKPAAAARAQ